jgi:ATP-dependent helicase/nuclease subunit A
VSAQRTEQQRAAATALDSDVFLRAGAGTGKTTVLVDRFCAAALDPEVGVEGILAFTFTERAADQLRRRVREELADRLDTDRAWISTIHGFCRQLLASHPAAAGIDPRFRVVDESEADRLAARAFDEALQQLVEAGEAEALELAAANRRRTLLEMTRGAYDELRSHGEPAPELPLPPRADPGARVGELLEAAREAHAECAEASGKGLASRDRIAAAAQLDPGAPASEELLETLAGLEIRSSAKAFQGEGCERYSRLLKRARSAVAAEVLAPAYEQLRELVQGFGLRYEELKSARSALDFEDLQLKAVELLAGSERVRGRYREQFRHLMVDEFQDTNGLQLRLIEQLRGPETRLFLVGDEFQSIYGFRHADVEVYRRQHRRFEAGEEPRGEALPLTGNFRAAPELVAATNAIGAGLLKGFEPLTAAVEPPRPGGGEPPVELLLTVDRKKEWEAPECGLPMVRDDPSSGSKVAEARRLATRLRELVEAGEDPSEIVVLLRAFTHVATVDRALAEAGLDPYVVGGRGFWSQQQIEDLRCLLAVISNPLDDEALFGALASPACAVLPDTLWLLRRVATEPADGGRERYLHVWPLLGDLVEGREPHVGDAEPAKLIPAEEMERLRGFAAALGELRGRGTEGGLEALVDRVATRFDYDLATLRREDGSARWANVRKLMRLAREFEAHEGPDLGGFLDYLDNRATSRDREAEAATRAEGHAGVRVMTVHAAKGLEFGVVAVADLGRNLQLGWTPLRVAPGEEGPDGGEAARVGVQLGRLGRPSERLHDYEQLAELAAQREAEEEARLAYVAATRAKRRLLLSGTFNPSKLEADQMSRKPIALQLIRSLLGGDPAEREVEVPAAEVEGAPSGRIRVGVSAPGPNAGAGLLVRREAEPEHDQPPAAEPPLHRPETPPALTGGLSYSALSDFERCRYRFYVERVLGIAEPEEAGVGSDGADGASPETRRRFGPGVAVHALLEWSARHRWRDPGPERAAAALREQGIDPAEAELERVLGLVGAWLSSPLREELAEGEASAEVPFVLSVGATLVRGSIDLLVQRADGPVSVVDYKTDRLEDRDPAEVAERYRVQRDLYALAATSRGTLVETAYVFLERPEDPVRERFEAADLDAARARIEALLGELAKGRLEVTDRPHRALCHDCPARERLCSYGSELTMRDSPEPPVSATEPAVPEGAQPQMSLLEGR